MVLPLCFPVISTYIDVFAQHPTNLHYIISQCESLAHSGVLVAITNESEWDGILGPHTFGHGNTHSNRWIDGVRVFLASLAWAIVDTKGIRGRMVFCILDFNFTTVVFYILLHLWPTEFFCYNSEAFVVLILYYH